MRIGILGGSFDPPHFGHLFVARQTREIIGLDQVWLMPYFSHSWDPVVASPQDRLAMTKLMEEPGIVASNEEITHGGKSYTIDTIRRLKASYKHSFFWIIGSDILPEIKRWKEPKSLTKEVIFLVFPRSGFPIPKRLPAGLLPVTSPGLVTTNISSTIVRNRLLKGLSVTGLTPDTVLAYIKEHKLYTANTKY